jgi:hypothetical protein
MTGFEFLTAFVAILIGLAVADLATSLHRLLRARDRVKWDWATPTAAAAVTIQVMAQFWVFWFSRAEERTYTFASTFVLACVLALVFLIASAVLPDEVPEAGIDLRVFYEENRRYFWSLQALYIATVTAQEWGMFSTPGHRFDLVNNAIGFANCILLVLFRWRWLQAIGLAGYLAVEIGRYFVWTTASDF